MKYQDVVHAIWTAGSPRARCERLPPTARTWTEPHPISIPEAAKGQLLILPDPMIRQHLARANNAYYPTESFSTMYFIQQIELG